MTHIKKFNENFEDKNLKEGTFDFFMSLSPDELHKYHPNYPNESDKKLKFGVSPQFVAWKKAVEIKGIYLNGGKYHNFE